MSTITLIFFKKNFLKLCTLMYIYILFHINFFQVLGLAYVSMADLEMSVVEFIDDEYFSTFESVIVQLGPKECLLVDSEANGELKNAKQVILNSITNFF